MPLETDLDLQRLKRVIDFSGIEIISRSLVAIAAQVKCVWFHSRQNTCILIQSSQ